MSLIKKLAGETAIYGLSHILSRVLLFIVFTIYLTRKFDGDTTEYGIYSDMYSYATIILTILVFRMDTAFFRFASGKGDLQKTFNTGFIAVLVFSVVILALLLPNLTPLAKLLHYDNSPHYIKWFAFILALDAISALVFARFRLESRPYRFMFYKVLNVGLTVFFVLLFLEMMPKWGSDYLDQLKGYLGITREIDFVFLANLFASALVIVAMLPELKTIKLEFDKALFKKMFWYSLPLVAVGIAGNINQAFAAPLQKSFLGEGVMENLANAGVYAAAAKLAILLNLFTTAFNYAAEPFFFKNAENKDSLAIYGKVALAFTIVACLVTLGLVVYIDVIILILGESYHSGKGIVPFLLFAYVFLGLYYNVSIWYKLKDKTFVGAIISIIGAAITIGVSLYLLPSIGTIGSAYASLICYIVMVILGYYIGRRYYPVDYPVAKILGIIGMTALLCIGAYQLRELVSPLLYYGSVTLAMIGIIGLVYRKEVKPLLQS